MLIDAHVHTSEASHYRRANGTRYPTPDELIQMMDEAGIAMAAVMSAISPECRYCYVTPDDTMRMHERFPDRLIPLANLDPRMLSNDEHADFRPMLTYFKEAGFRGIGEYFPNLPFDDPKNLNVFKQVEEIGLPLTFHIAPKRDGVYGVYDEPGLPRLETVLKNCPELVLIGHSQPFWAEISADLDADNRNAYPTGRVTPGRVVTLMREYPNLHADLSAGSGYNAIARDPEFGYRFLEEFQDRLYFGTDIASTNQNLPIVSFFQQLQNERLVDSEAYEKITWRNAARVFNVQAVIADSSP